MKGEAKIARGASRRVWGGGCCRVGEKGEQGRRINSEEDGVKKGAGGRRKG